MTAREAWKKYYRTMRVVRRESHKASVDAMLYGAGFLHVPSDSSDPKRIPPWDVVLSTKEGAL